MDKNAQNDNITTRYQNQNIKVNKHISHLFSHKTIPKLTETETFLPVFASLRTSKPPFTNNLQPLKLRRVMKTW
jgi:hypothetical protein